MLSYQFYNLVHIVGIILIMMALGGIALTASGAVDRNPTWTRRSVAVLQGMGIFLILLGGFGMLARLGIMHGSGWPGWLWVKVGVWATLAAVAFLPYRFPATARPLLLVVPALGGLAAYMAIYKPL
ncbi:hypothetical protein BH24GEM3_BH24GEM3_09170 [soil metagenome]